MHGAAESFFAQGHGASCCFWGRRGTRWTFGSDYGQSGSPKWARSRDSSTGTNPSDEFLRLPAGSPRPTKKKDPRPETRPRLYDIKVPEEYQLARGCRPARRGPQDSAPAGHGSHDRNPPDTTVVSAALSAARPRWRDPGTRRADHHLGVSVASCGGGPCEGRAGGPAPPAHLLLRGRTSRSSWWAGRLRTPVTAGPRACGSARGDSSRDHFRPPTAINRGGSPAQAGLRPRPSTAKAGGQSLATCAAPGSLRKAVMAGNRPRCGPPPWSAAGVHGRPS